MRQSLAGLATLINAAYERVVRAVEDSLTFARELGDLLIQAKARASHGEWLPWLEKNCTVGARQAQRYMRIAERWEVIQSATSETHLSILDALDAIALHREPRADDEAADAGPDDGAIGDITAKALAGLPASEQLAVLQAEEAKIEARAAARRGREAGDGMRQLFERVRGHLAKARKLLLRAGPDFEAVVVLVDAAVAGSREAEGRAAA